MKRCCLILLWLVCLAGVVAGSLLPAASPLLAPASLLNDKLEHFLAYAVLAAIPAVAFPARRAVFLALAFLFVLGASLEFAQGFSPGRFPDWRDQAANTLGILSGAALLRRRPGVPTVNQ